MLKQCSAPVRICNITSHMEVCVVVVRVLAMNLNENVDKFILLPPFQLPGANGHYAIFVPADTAQI